MEDFVSILEDFFCVKQTPIAIADKWHASPLKEAKDMNSGAFWDGKVFTPLCHDYYEEYSESS